MTKSMRRIKNKVSGCIVQVAISTILLSCFSQQKNNSDESERLTFIREVVLLDTINFKHTFNFSDTDVTPNSLQIVNGGTTFTKFIDYVSFLLNESDTTLLREQFKEKKQFFLTKSIHNSIKIVPMSEMQKNKISTDSIWSYLNKLDTRQFCSVSAPIFNKNHDKAYFKFGCFCGDLCGGGFEVVTEKVNNKWVIKERLGSWSN